MRGDLLVRGERRDSLLHAMVVTDAASTGTYL